MTKKYGRREHGTGSIFKVGDFYRLRIRNAIGKFSSCKLFNPDGKGCTNYQDAIVAANLILDKERQFNELDSREKVIKELAAIRNLRAKLTITMMESIDYMQNKASASIPTQKHLQSVRRNWQDFADFVKDKFSITSIAEIEKSHAEEYFAYLQQNGKYSTSGGAFKLSNKTINTYIKNCRYVFNRLLDDLGYREDENPFYKIKLLKKKSTSRQVFSENELKAIFNSPPPLMKGLFTIGLCTGLRLSDVATLKWDEVKCYAPDSFGKPDFYASEIDKITDKTGKRVMIPVMSELADYLSEQWTISQNETYVLPDAAKIHLGHKGLSVMVIKYLNSLRIETSQAIDGRCRKQNIKGFHSLRHSFCYYAGLRGIPLNIVQSIVGHATEEMTMHYQQHADREAKRNALQLMKGLITLNRQNILPSTASSSVSEFMQHRIAEFVEKADEISLLKVVKLIDEITNTSSGIKEEDIAQKTTLIIQEAIDVATAVPVPERPNKEVLEILIAKFNRPRISRLFEVAETTIRKWLKKYDIPAPAYYRLNGRLEQSEIDKLREMINNSDCNGLNAYQEPIKIKPYCSKY